MIQHPTEKELLRFRQGGAGAGEAAIREHLGSCHCCRNALLAAARFDDVVRQGLKREAAPDHLMARIQQGLAQSAARPAAAARSLLRPLALGAAAALLLAAVGLTSLWLWTSQAAPAAAPGDGRGVAAVQVLRGQLVCFGCARRGADMEHQRLCAGDGDLHVTGLRTPDGNTWRFVEGKVIHPFLADPSLRGQWIEVSASPYPAIGYLQIAAARQL